LKSSFFFEIFVQIPKKPPSIAQNRQYQPDIADYKAVGMRIFLKDSPEKRRFWGLKSAARLKVLTMKRQSVAGMGAD